MAQADPFASIAQPLQQQAAPSTPVAPAASAPAASSDPFASIAQPVQQDTTSGAQTAAGGPGALARFGIGAEEGAVESMGQTIQSIPWIGKKIISPEAMAAERATFAPGSPAEKSGQYAGQIAEPILEFVLGDEALKGLALSQKVGLAGKIADIAKTNPYIAKLIQHGVIAARLGTVATADELAHGATPGQAVTRGAEVAGTGAGLGIASDAAKAVAPKIGEVTSKIGLKNPFRTVEVGGTKLSATPAFNTAGREIASQQAVRNIATDVSDTAGGAPVSQAESMRNVWEQPTEALKLNARQYYAALDNASDGQWSRIQNKIDSLRNAMRNGTGDYDALLKQKTELEGLQDEILQNVPQGTETAARKAWTQYSRAEDLHDLFNRYGLGTPGEMATPGVSEPENANWKGLLTRLNAMASSGDLTDAMGGNKQAAKDLIATVDLASRKGWAAAKTAQAVKYVLDFGLGYAIGRR